MPEPEFKYLSIRNWSKFQTTTDKNGKPLDGRPRPYIRDYCDKETDSQYADLRVFGRYFFDACRRLRGKLGRNLPNDHMWILRQLDVHSTERGRSTHAIQALIARRLLIPTNEQFDLPQPASPSLSVEVYIEGKGIRTGNCTVAGTGTGKPKTLSQTEQEEKEPKPESYGDWKDRLLRDEDQQRKIDSVMCWKETVSTFWKGKPVHSLRAYRVIEAQYDKFYAKLPPGKKPHEIAEEVPGDPNGGPPDTEESPELSKMFEIED